MSSLTIRHLDQLSGWIIYTHYAIDDYVKRWSNSVRYSMLKFVTSRLWRHRVTWRHRWRQYSTTVATFL